MKKKLLNLDIFLRKTSKQGSCLHLIFSLKLADDPTRPQ